MILFVCHQFACQFIQILIDQADNAVYPVASPAVKKIFP